MKKANKNATITARNAAALSRADAAAQSMTAATHTARRAFMVRLKKDRRAAVPFIGLVDDAPMTATAAEYIYTIAVRAAYSTIKYAYSKSAAAGVGVEYRLNTMYNDAAAALAAVSLHGIDGYNDWIERRADAAADAAALGADLAADAAQTARADARARKDAADITAQIARARKDAAQTARADAQTAARAHRWAVSHYRAGLAAQIARNAAALAYSIPTAAARAAQIAEYRAARVTAAAQTAAKTADRADRLSIYADRAALAADLADMRTYTAAADAAALALARADAARADARAEYATMETITRRRKDKLTGLYVETIETDYTDDGRENMAADADDMRIACSDVADIIQTAAAALLAAAHDGAMPTFAAARDLMPTATAAARNAIYGERRHNAANSVDLAAAAESTAAARADAHAELTADAIIDALADHIAADYPRVNARRCVEMFRLNRVDGYSRAAIAAVYGVSQTVVDRAIKTAAAALADHWNDLYEMASIIL